MPPSSCASLEITSSTHSVSTIAVILGLEPSTMRELTDSQSSLWRWDVAPGAHALESLLSVLHDRAAELRALREHFNTAIVVSSSRQLAMSAHTLAELALSGCDIRLETASVLERAELPVRPGMEAEFERNFAQARHLVAESPGCRSVSLVRGIESPSLYILLIEWDSVESHEVSFRQSERYAEWRALLHHFYDPFPTVEHFSPVFSD